MGYRLAWNAHEPLNYTTFLVWCQVVILHKNIAILRLRFVHYDDIYFCAKCTKKPGLIFFNQSRLPCIERRKQFLSTWIGGKELNLAKSTSDLRPPRLFTFLSFVGIMIILLEFEIGFLFIHNLFSLFRFNQLFE